MLTVLIPSYLEEEHVESIEAVDEKLRVLYREDLVPPPRWPGDHVGPPGWCRTPEGEREFLAVLKEAEVLYDFPPRPCEGPEHGGCRLCASILYEIRCRVNRVPELPRDPAHQYSSLFSVPAAPVVSFVAHVVEINTPNPPQNR